MRIRDIIPEERGPRQGWSNYCKNTSTENMPSSWLSSCKARGLKSRDTGKTQKIGSKRVKLGGKRMKSVKYGGPVSPTKTG